MPHHQSELLLSALQEAGVECTLHSVEGGGHGQGFGRDERQAVRRFFAKHLLGRSIEPGGAGVRLR